MKSPNKTESETISKIFDNFLVSQANIIEMLPNIPPVEIIGHDLYGESKLFGAKIPLEEDGRTTFKDAWVNWLKGLKPKNVTYEIIENLDKPLEQTVYEAVIEDTVKNLPSLKKGNPNAN